MVSKTDVLHCFFNINPIGNIDMIVAAINVILNGKEYTNDGDDVTFELLCDRYKQYCDVTDAKNEGTEDRWIKQEDKKKEPIVFLNAELYKQKFELRRTSRDHYLFGNMKTDEFKLKHKEFVNEIGNR